MGNKTYTLTYTVEITVEADSEWEAKEEGYDELQEMGVPTFWLQDCQED